MLIALHPACSVKSEVPLAESERISIIQTAELFFASLKRYQFSETWAVLTEKSRTTIIKDILSNIKDGEKLAHLELQNDFQNGGPLSKSFWSAYLENFNPDMALKDSTWTVGKVDATYAEIILRYKTAETPAVLRLYKEGGLWKFGLVESFWTRKPKRFP